jgi:hypothetical protein
VIANNGSIWLASSSAGSIHATNRGGQDVVLTRLSPFGDQEWGFQFGTPLDDVPAGIGVDDFGGIVVAGTTSGSLAGSWGASDGFVRRHAATGEVIWTRQFGTVAPEEVTALALDANGNAFVVGWTWGDLSGQNAGSADVFVRKYDGPGSLLWSRQFGTTDEDVPFGVAVDAAGNVYVVGQTVGDLAGTQGSADAFVRKYSASGAHRWTRQFGTTLYDRAVDVAFDTAGRVVITGWTIGDLYAGNAGSADVFVARFGTGGGFLSGRQFGSTDDDIPGGVAVDPLTGAIFVAGHTLADLPGHADGVGADVFLRRFSANLNPGWIRQYDSFGNDEVSGLAFSPGDGIYVAGSTTGGFGGGNVGAQDAFMMRLTLQGRRTWTDQ